MTNADKIRAMTDEELANFLESIMGDCSRCPADGVFRYCGLEQSCKKAFLTWLKQEG